MDTYVSRRISLDINDSVKSIIKKDFDAVVVGGGMSGLCAAIACARQGTKTALIHNRPVLGGNASSEIRMHICGAACSWGRKNARETGIVEEILLDNKKINLQSSFSIFDTILWEKATFQENLSLFLNTHMIEVNTEEAKITSIKAVQLTTEKTFEINGKIFIDATGDGTMAFLAGAEYMFGREDKRIFNEELAPDGSDDCTMGNTLMFRAIDMGKPVKFEKPFWANTYTEEDLAKRNHKEIITGYWWIELGGITNDTTTDGEEIRDELLKAVYGIWDHIKNSGHHDADNLALEWVGFLPGKRESRRIVGDYILTEKDLLEGKYFEDAVAYGGWPIDDHVHGDLNSIKSAPNRHFSLKDMYNIPYRSLYSRNIRNLMIGGRAISVSHIAFSSTRVMGTCSVVGQAIGIAASMCIKQNILPRDVLNIIKELQSELVKNDCYIHKFYFSDSKNLAESAKVSCSTQLPEGKCDNIINGVTRMVGNNTNCWISDKITRDKDEWISMEFECKINPKTVYITFDSNLSKEIMLSLSPAVMKPQHPGVPIELVKDYKLTFYNDSELVYKEEVKDNYQRHRIHKIPGGIICNKIVLSIQATNGDEHARIFEIMVY